MNKPTSFILAVGILLLSTSVIKSGGEPEMPAHEKPTDETLVTAGPTALERRMDQALGSFGGGVICGALIHLARGGFITPSCFPPCPPADPYTSIVWGCFTGCAFWIIIECVNKLAAEKRDSQLLEQAKSE